MLDLFPNKSGIFFLLSLFSEHCKTATAKYCGTSIGGEDRGGLPDLDPDLSKSRGGHPESPDEKVGRIGIYPNLSQLIWPNKSGKVGIYPAQKLGRIGIHPDFSRLTSTYPDLPRLIPNYLEIKKVGMAIPIPIPDPSRPDFVGILFPSRYLAHSCCGNFNHGDQIPLPTIFSLNALLKLS